MSFTTLFPLLMIFSMASACTTSKNIFIVGDPNIALKTTAYAELKEEDWTNRTKSCITHLYKCKFDETGKVTGIEALDISAPDFKELSEEAIHAWTFKPGQSGQCFVDFIYPQNSETKVLIVPEAIAKTMVETRRANRQKNENQGKKTHPKSISHLMPSYPKDAALRGVSGLVTVTFDLNPAGEPENLQVTQSTPKGIFDSTTLHSLRQWRYPTLAQEPDKERTGLTTTITYQLDGVWSLNCDLGF